MSQKELTVGQLHHFSTFINISFFKDNKVFFLNSAQVSDLSFQNRIHNVVYTNCQNTTINQRAVCSDID